MRNLLLTKIFLLGVLMLTAFVDVKSQNIFLNEDFSSGSLPTWWTDQKDDLSSASWGFSDAVATFDGGNKFGSSAALITGAIDLSESIMPTLSFTYSVQHVRGVTDSLVVLYCTADDPTWRELFVCDVAQSEQTEVSFELTDAQQAEGFQLRFESWNRFGGAITIDDVKIINALACTTPLTSLQVSELTSTSVKMLWLPIEYSDSAEIYLTIFPITNFDRISSSIIAVDTTVVSRSPIGFFSSGDILSPNTKYYFYIRSSCGSGDVSEYISTSFTTPCSLIEIEEDDAYTEGFENGVGCWAMSSPTETYATVSSAYKYEGSNSLYFNTDEAEYSYAIAPFDVDLSEMEISFYLYTTVTTSDAVSAKVRVSVVDNPGDLSDMTEIIEIEATTSGKWQKFITTFRDYTGSGQYIVLSAGDAEATNTIYIDNVEVKKSTGCYEPLLVYADDIRSYSANLYWNEVGTATSWNIRVSETELRASDLETSQATDLVATTMPYKITTLTPSTTHYVYIQSGGCYWNTEPVIIETYSSLTLNYFNEFEYDEIDELQDEDWYYGNIYGTSDPSSWVVTPYLTGNFNSPLIGGNYGYSAGAALYLSVFADYSNTYPFILLPEIDNTLDLNQIQITFYFTQDRLDVPFVVSMCEGYDILTAVPVDTIYPAAATVFEKFFVTFENYSGDGRNLMISPLIGADLTSDISYYLDDFSLEILEACHPVNNISFSNIEPYATTVSWSTSGDLEDATWTIELYKDSKTDGATCEKSYTATSSPFVMTGLEMATRYYVSILLNSAKCDDTEWSTEVSFKTVEEIVLPYFNDFTGEPEGEGAGGPEGWICYNVANEESKYVPYTDREELTIPWSAPLDFTAPSLKFYSKTDADSAIYAIMPIADSGLDMSNLAISYYIMGTSDDFLRNMAVGIMTDPNEPTSFVALDYFAPESANIVYKRRFTTEKYTGSGRYIAFKAYTDNTDIVSLYIDNIKIETPSDCETVTDVVISAPDVNTLDVSWTKGLNETSWEVRAFTELITLNNIEDKTPISTATTSVEKVSLTGLTHVNELTYYLAIKSKGNDCESQWYLASYTVGCDFAYLETPYFEKFDDYGIGSGTSPDCWYLKPNASFSYAQMQYSSLEPDYEFGTKSGGTLYLTGQSALATTVGYSYAIMPRVDSLRYKTLEFYFYSWGSSYSCYVEVGIMSDVDDTFKNQSVYYTDVPANDKLFQSIFTFTGSQYLQYELVSYDFSSYVGDGDRIAFRVGMHKDSAQPGIAVIDHLSLKNTEPCAAIRDITATALSTDSISYSWDVLYESEWEVKISATEIDPSLQDGDVVSSERITELPYTVKGLAENTKYYCYARRIITGDDACEGEWSEAYGVRTMCSVISEGFSDDFEANEEYGVGTTPHCWLTVGDVDVMPYPQINSIATTGQASTADNKVCLAIENSSYTLSGNTFYSYVYASLPELDGDVKDVELSFRVYNPSSSGGSIEVGVATNVSTYDSFSDSFTSQYKDTIPAGEWTTIRVNFADYTNDAMGKVGKYIAIGANPGWDGSEVTSNIIYIDDVVVSEYNGSLCETPIRFKAESVGDSEVTFSWMANNINGYELAINTKAVVDENNNFVYVTTDTSMATIKELPIGTTLYAAVRSICEDNSYTEWTDIVEFRTTGCDADLLPYFEGFENDISTIYNCQTWVHYDANAPVDVLAYSTYYKMTGTCLEVPSGKLCILPFNNVSSLILSIDVMKLESPYYAKAGVARYDANDSLIFVSFADLQPSKTYTAETFTVDFSDYASQIQDGDQIAIFANAQWNDDAYYRDIYLDNINVIDGDALTMPENLALVSLTNNSATFTADLHKNTKEVEVAIMQGSETTSTTTNFQTITDISNLTISNLSPLTSYRIAIRVKDDTDYSDWSIEELSFTTLQNPIGLPLDCKFADDTENSNWLIEADDAVNTWIIGSQTGYDNDGKALYITNGGDDAYSYAEGTTSCLAYRDFVIEKPGIYTVSLMAKCGTTDANDYLSVSVTSTSSDANQYLVVDKLSGSAEWKEYSSDITITEAGTYRFAALFEADNTTADGEPAAIDNISIKELMCSGTFDFESEVTYNSASLVWSSVDGVTSWDIIISEQDVTDASTLVADDIFASQTDLTSSSYTVSDLNSSTTYYVYVKSNCEDKDYDQYQITTSLAPKGIPYYESFVGEYTTDDVLNMGYEVVSGSIGSGTYFSDDRIYMDANTYLQFPKFDASYKLSDLVLDLEVMSSSTTSFDISIGVLETTATSSFVTLETVTVPANSSGDWSEYTVMLSGYTGSTQNLAIKYTATTTSSGRPGTTTTTSLLILGSVYLYEIPACFAPSDLQISDVTDIEASLSFAPLRNQEAWDVVVLNDEATQDELNAMTATDVVFMAEDITNYTGVSINGLSELTTYYVYVRGNCDDVAIWSDVATFTTIVSPKYIPYSELFTTTTVGELPSEWIRSNSDIDGEFEVLSTSSENYSDFAVANVDGISSSPLLFASMNSDETAGVYYWAISPEVVIDESALLSFDLRLGEGENYALLADTVLSARESEIRVLMSNDDAATWSEVLVIGDNAADDYQLYDFLNTTIKVKYDMSSYIGDTIRFAFYIDNEDLVYLDVNIDDISINCMGERTYDVVLSEGYDYTENGFNISYEELNIGENNGFEKFIPSPELGICDSTYTVNLTILETVVRNITAEICAGGSVYDANGFTESYEGLYLNENVAVNGADSLTYLTLIARQASELTLKSASICGGEEYTFGDLVLTESGVYYDTLVDVNGCDSIIELTLNIISNDELVTEEATICDGDYYELSDGTQYTEAGTYEVPMITDAGCEYTVELTLSVTPVDTVPVMETITLENLPYTYGDYTFDETTEVGTYTATFTVDNGKECPDVILYSLTVIEGDVAVDNTSILNLSMYPNPLSAGATLYVNAEFTAAERNGMVIEVTNAVGQLVISERPTTDEITINGLTQSGVYIVRITTGTGVQHLGKVIVK